MSTGDALHALHRQQALRDVDMAFAALLDRLKGGGEVQLAGALAMRAIALGHSGFALDKAQCLLEELQAEAELPAAGDWQAALRASDLVASDTQTSVPLVFEHGRVSLRRYARYEADLVQRLLQRKAADTNAPESTSKQKLGALRQLFALPTPELDRQALAAWLALRQKLLLLTGGPGTGKTTAVARMLALLLAGDKAPRIALAAPTGRAAARLGEAIASSVQRDVEAGRLDAALAQAIPQQAQTLHRLLGWRSGSVEFRHHADNPLPFDVVIVDEASMIDLPLMAKLVGAVRDAATLILIGDPDQLPAVEAGDVLGALCDASGDGATLPPALSALATAELQAQVPATQIAAPLSGHRVHLQRAYRQAGSARLMQLAKATGSGNADAVIAALRDNGEGVRWREGDARQLEAALAEFALPAYRDMLAAPDPQSALQLSTRVRVLTALRNGPFGAAAWNAWFARKLGGNSASPWFHGRLVMVTANDYRLNLFNGDTGIAWQDENGDIAVWFERHAAPWRPAQLPAHETAFAGTVHKAQGSEFDRIALILPDTDARVLNRELVHTALTRARSEALLWAGERSLREAIGRRSRRDTGLRARFSVNMPAPQ
ncbi:MAG: exodeoxyribonuclease V subunit alpha [Pseudoxanthomonas sp.]